MKLKIYSGQKYLPQGMIPDPILYPFWSEFITNQQYSWSRAYDRYIEISSSIFEMTSLEDADFAIMPANWRTIRGDSWRSKVNKNALNLSIQFAETIEKLGKPLVVFFSGDCSDEEIPVRNAIMIRQGIYRSKRKQNDFSMPAFIEDLVKHYLVGQIPIRQKADKPVVGFCGLVKGDSWKRKLQGFAYHGLMLLKSGELGVSPYKGEILRSTALRILEESPLVDTNFIIRGDSVFLNAQTTQEQKQKVRIEFVKNMVESDYILNCRGSGNCSIRLIETLCCGRIPIFIDTDCVLPYDFAIDWKKYCVWIEEKEIPWIAEKVADFHSNISQQEFIDLQHECRKIWKDWLSPEGFYANLHRHLGNNLLN